MATQPKKKPRTTRALTANEAAKHARKAPPISPPRLMALDRNSRAYKAELRRQAHNLANAPDNEDVMKFIESLYVDWE
ncbi:MAG TPA: antitoxin MazE-like protein [Stellaceae bacterium]